jgi:23S rRNA (uracil1939-C5)-methyltransferase
VPAVFHKVLDIASCLLQPDEGNRILSDIRDYLRSSDLPMYCPRSHQGFWRFVMLRHSVAYDNWMVNIITAADNRSAVQPLADILVSHHPRIISVVNNITARKAGISAGEYEILLYGCAHLRDRLCGYAFDISANSFFQTNSRGAQILYRTVLAYAGLTGNETVFDLYCGTGTIAICLSKYCRRIVGFDIVDAAIRDAENNCRINGISNCTFFRGDIRTSLSETAIRPDVMVMDPPRDGLHKDVVQQVLNLLPERIIYVSCNPATLARDLAVLKDAYHVMEVQPVDMFPHTFHIESVARLERRIDPGETDRT